MIVVTGATGNVGRHVALRLHEEGHPVRALSRNPARLDLPAGIATAALDPDRPETLSAAFEGATGVFLYTVERAGDLVEAARAAGARRVALLSSGAVPADDPDAIDPQTNPIGAHHRAVERVIEASGLDWTFLRPNQFATNALMWRPQIAAGDVVEGPYPDATAAPIHERDMAEVAVRALTEEGHAGRAYELTGPVALSQAEQVRVLGEAIGRPLKFETVSLDRAREVLSGQVPDWAIDGMLAAYAAMVGGPVKVLPTVAEVTGSPALTFAEWAADHVADFR